jgi:hypothetical protein
MAVRSNAKIRKNVPIRTQMNIKSTRGPIDKGFFYSPYRWGYSKENEKGPLRHD